MSGGGETQTETKPPGYARPLVDQYVPAAQELYQQPYEQYPGTRIAGFNPWERQALQGYADRAQQGSPLIDQAGNMLQDTLSGNYLNSNPWVDQMISQTQSGVIDKFNNEVTPSTVAQFAQYGGGNITNTGLAQLDAMNRYDLSRTLGEIDTGYRMPLYESERARQFQAVPQAMQVGNQEYADLAALQTAGQTKRQMSQARQDLEYQQWLEQQQYPYRQLDMLGNAFQTASGGYGNTSQSVQNALWPMIAGTALLGADVGSNYIQPYQPGAPGGSGGK